MRIFVFILMSLMQMKEKLEISSPSFNQEGSIPSKYTCEGLNINPSLSIKNIPVFTKSLVLIMDDPDATKGTFDHWIVWNIKPVEIIPENSTLGVMGKNSAGENNYTGPCPPTGTHRYFFKIYAIDVMLSLKQGADKIAVEDAISGHILASGEIMAYYKKIK